MATSLPAHGKIACSRCFHNQTVWNVTDRRTEDGWHVINNPMSWGSEAPKILVLGVSKGTTQCDSLNTKPFDQVAFDGFRPRLTDALRLLGLLSSSEIIDEKINTLEKDWAFGSMVRCALGLVDVRNGQISRSGSVVKRLAQLSTSSSWLSNCSDAFLSNLPDRLDTVVLLSNDDSYIAACCEVISRLRPNTKRINSVAYSDERITWVHIVHVGGPGKNHIADWFAGRGTQGEKRLKAQDALFARSQRTLNSMYVAAEPDRSRPHLPKEFRANLSRDGSFANVTRQAIVDYILARTDVKLYPHQSHPHGTKYIVAFQTVTGTIFAIDKGSKSKCPFWILDTPQRRLVLKQADIGYELYPSHRGRNSNLHKLAGFKDGMLIRAYPSSVEEASRILDLLFANQVDTRKR